MIWIRFWFFFWDSRFERCVLWSLERHVKIDVLDVTISFKSMILNRIPMKWKSYLSSPEILSRARDPHPNISLGESLRPLSYSVQEWIRDGCLPPEYETMTLTVSQMGPTVDIWSCADSFRDNDICLLCVPVDHPDFVQSEVRVPETSARVCSVPRYAENYNTPPFLRQSMSQVISKCRSSSQIRMICCRDRRLCETVSVSFAQYQWERRHLDSKQSDPVHGKMWSPTALLFLCTMERKLGLTTEWRSVIDVSSSLIKRRTSFPSRRRSQVVSWRSQSSDWELTSQKSQWLSILVPRRVPFLGI